VPRIEVWNKIDRLHPDERDALLTRAEREEQVYAVSALTGDGLDVMLRAVTDLLQGETVEEELLLGFDEGRRRSWLFAKGLVTDERQEEDGFVVRVRWSAKDRAQFQSL
jgi:GTPase